MLSFCLITLSTYTHTHTRTHTRAHTHRHTHTHPPLGLQNTALTMSQSNLSFLAPPLKCVCPWELGRGFSVLYSLSLFPLIYFWLRWVFVAGRGLSLVVASGGYSSLRCTDCSLQWLLLLRSRALGVWASVVMARGLSSCGTDRKSTRLNSSH